MLRTILVSLISTALLLLSTMSEHSLVLELLVLAASATVFFKIGKDGKSPTIKIVVVFITSNLIVGASLFMPFIDHIDLPWMGVGCMITTSACFGYLLRDREYLQQKNTWFLIWTSLLLFIATRALASVDRYEVGFAIIWAYFLAFGLLLGHLKFPFGKAMIILAPQALLPILLIFDPAGQGANQWIVSLLQPLIMGVLFVGSYLLTKSKGLLRWSLVVPSIVAIFLYHLQIEGYLFKQSEEAIHEKLAPYALEQLSGDTIRSQELAGKVVWMSFYSSTCGVCVKELPHVAAVADKFKDNPNVDFLAVNSIHFESFEKFRDSKVFHTLGVKTTYEYEDNLAKTFAPTGVPVGILIDQNGVAVIRKEGFMPSDKEYFEEWLTKEINTLLDQAS